MTYLLFLIGLVLFLYGIYKYKKKSLTIKYVPRQVDIKQYGVREEKVAQLYVEVIYYKPWFSYQYEIDGNTHLKTKDEPEYLKFTDRQEANEYQKKILAQNSVYVSKTNPEESVLVLPNRMEILNRTGGFIFSGIALVAVALIIHFIKQ